MNEAVAVITFDPKNGTPKDLKLTTNLRFKCKRCAALCCKLGGPPLTRKDVEQIKKAGYRVNDFLEPINRNVKVLPQTCGTLKTRADGSCIFLQSDNEQKQFTCSIYDFRPALCRLYPFSFEKQGSNSIALKIIPCCMGLNNPEGEQLTEHFVASRLLEPLMEAMQML
ncbi:MAG: hypothetical protein CW691_00065 [Candidatus Bathyarchaeum sp.]|nr:MAG: hypothetical protein CW691_00065 [Candidatus Bathyarchaeum sp.]